MPNEFEENQKRNLSSIAFSLNRIAEHLTTDLVSVDELRIFLEGLNDDVDTAEDVAVKLVEAFDIRQGK